MEIATKRDREMKSRAEVNRTPQPGAENTTVSEEKIAQRTPRAEKNTISCRKRSTVLSK